MLRALARGTLSEESSDESTEEEGARSRADSLPSVSTFNVSSSSVCSGNNTTNSSCNNSSEDDFGPSTRTQSEYDAQWLEMLCTAVDVHMMSASTEVYCKWSAIRSLLQTYHTNTQHLAREAERDHSMLTQLRSEMASQKMALQRTEAALQHAETALQRVEQVYVTALGAYEEIK